MAHGVTTDKTLSKVHMDLDSITSDAVRAAKNVAAQFLINWPGQTPSQHRWVFLVGTTVPDNTDYPDSIAPIGSWYQRLIITSGAVAGSLLYIKTAAATWTAQS